MNTTAPSPPVCGRTNPAPRPDTPTVCPSRCRSHRRTRPDSVLSLQTAGQEDSGFQHAHCPHVCIYARYLTTGENQFFHQSTSQPSTEFYALCRGHRGDTSGTGCPPTGVPNLADQTAFNGTLSIRLSAVFTCVAITAAVNTEQSAQ